MQKCNFKIELLSKILYSLDLMETNTQSPSPDNQNDDLQAPTGHSPAPDAQTEIAPAAEHNHNKPNRHQNWRDFFSIALVVLSALVLALGLIYFVFQSYQVSGPSMESTLQNNDRLVVWKVPRTWARITGHSYVPDRGDIIVFNEPGLLNFGSSDKQLIKRVIGLPGDRVVVKNNVITIYNKAHPTGFQPDKTLPYGNVIPKTTGNIDETLGAHQIFVCGDNRPDSLDSRIFGPVNVNNVIGKLVIRVLPINQTKLF